MKFIIGCNGLMALCLTVVCEVLGLNPSIGSCVFIVRYTALAMGSTPLLLCLGRLSLSPLLQCKNEK